MSSANYYISKIDFFDAVTGSKSQSAVSDDLARIFMLLVNRYANTVSWVGYPSHVKDELKSNALYDLVRSFHKFDETRENPNPFAYYTSVIVNSFCKTINKEKAYLNFKTFLFQASDNTNSSLYKKHIEKHEGIGRYLNTIDDTDDIDTDFEEEKF